VLVAAAGGTFSTMVVANESLSYERSNGWRNGVGFKKLDACGEVPAGLGWMHGRDSLIGEFWILAIRGEARREFFLKRAQKRS
jgi:hypothetical protein